MIRFSIVLKRAAAALVLGSAFLLGGCHLFGGTKGQVNTAQWEGKFDTTIESYKEGQFVVDGAVLSAIDTGSHFAYLRDTGKLPKTVLLMPSSEYKIRKVHLQYLARMAIDYGFTAYYDDGGKLTQINAVNTKAARKLEEASKALPQSEQQKCMSAAGCSSIERAQQQQQGGG